jgi:hypothetical protein
MLFPFADSLCVFFPKEKGEKESNPAGIHGRHKGNGIIGGDPSGEAAVYAVVFLQTDGRLKNECPALISCSTFFGKNTVINSPRSNPHDF